MKILLLAALASVALIASGGAGNSSPVGLWLAKDGGKIRISSCGGGLCGYIAHTNPPIDPETQRPWTDKNNVNPGKRNRRLVGIQLLISMKPKGAGTWSGHLYNVDDGKTYAGNLIEQGHASVKIEGCSIGVCGGEELTRLK
jgi:uncharacterized protein (DUF2147 family)